MVTRILAACSSAHIPLSTSEYAFLIPFWIRWTLRETRTIGPLLVR